MSLHKTILEKLGRIALVFYLIFSASFVVFYLLNLIFDFI